MEGKTRGIGVYLVIIAGILVLFYFLQKNLYAPSELTWQQFQEAVDQEYIESVVVTQNPQPPTGQLQLKLKGNSSMAVLNVSDVVDLSLIHI